MRVIVAEDDPFLRVVQVILDPAADPARRAAFADFFAHDEPDFDGFCERVRSRASHLRPSTVRLVEDTAQLRAALPAADALIVESLPVGEAELAAAPRLSLVLKHGVNLRNADVAACERAGVEVRTLRRRANIACAESAMALMLMLARRLQHWTGKVTEEALGPLRPFDRRHTGMSNWARIGGLRSVYGTTLGIVGLGEIGRELALRANAFGLRVLYWQRRRWGEADERAMGVEFRPLDQLMAESDWIAPILPSDASTRGLIGRVQLALLKPGACLVNVSRADIVDREALLEALRSGRLAGLGLDPQYEVPVREDDELLALDNVILTPHIAAQPRFNALQDISDVVAILGEALRP